MFIHMNYSLCIMCSSMSASIKHWALWYSTEADLIAGEYRRSQTSELSLARSNGTSRFDGGNWKRCDIVLEVIEAKRSEMYANICIGFHLLRSAVEGPCCRRVICILSQI